MSLKSNRIIYISNSPLPSRSANSIHVMKMCEAFLKSGIDITLVIPLRLKNLDLRIDVFNFYSINKKFKIKKLLTLPGRGMALFYFLAMFYSIFRKTDIIYTREIEAAALSSFIRKKFILEMHSYFIDKIDEVLFRKISKKHYFKKLVLISNSLRSRLINYGFGPEKIMVLPDAVDLNIFSKKNKKENSRIRVGYGGHLFSGRGIEIIVKLAELMPDIDFFLWGGTEEFIDFWKEKTKKINNIYFKGFVKSSILAKELVKCDVLLMPYQKKVAVFGNRHDTVDWMSPMKMFEYMATARPIIASDLPVIREILTDGKNAILVKCDDTQEWKKAINSLIRNREFAENIGKNARNDVENNYTWDIRVKKILELL
jgi:glycosyltransferase involved in cell wall biosynthesis